MQLGLDIDAPHPAQVTPLSRPHAAGSEKPLDQIPAIYRSPSYLHTHSPADVWEALRSEASTQELSDQEVWSLVAAIWQSNTSAQRLAEGQALYTQNCAACHGEDGAGDGVFADQLANQDASMDMQMEGVAPVTPIDFTNPELMLGASPALLQGKILRGGMGTGMPYWGPIFTETQIWSLVEYLWVFQFDYDSEVNP